MKKALSILLSAVTLISLTSCGNGEPPQVEYLAYLCDLKTKNCYEPDIYRFKVIRHEKTILLNIYDAKGNPENNQFLKECDILNKNNWRCRDLSMVDGKLIDNINNMSGGLYWRYERRVR